LLEYTVGARFSETNTAQNPKGVTCGNSVTLPVSASSGVFSPASAHSNRVVPYRHVIHIDQGIHCSLG
jgi:hypothetical protein